MNEQPAETLQARLRTFEDAEAKLHGAVAPGVYAYGAVRPLGRIRAYTSAGLGPFAGRGMPSEFLLLGHIHIDSEGRILRVEGFNGQEGERWAKQAQEKLKAAALLDGVVVIPATPLRNCQYTGVR